MIKLQGLSGEKLREIARQTADAFYDYTYNGEDIGLISCKTPLPQWNSGAAPGSLIRRNTPPCWINIYNFEERRVRSYEIRRNILVAVRTDDKKEYSAKI